MSPTAKRLLPLLPVILALSCTFQQVVPPASGPTPVPGAALGELLGKVELQNPGQADFVPASLGSLLLVRGRVRTAAGGRSRLDFSNGTLVRLGSGTLLTLAANQMVGDSLSTRLILDQGQVWAGMAGGTLDVQTPAGTASGRGAFLSIRIDSQSGDVQVDCMAGACQASTPAVTLNLVSGQGALLTRRDPSGSASAPAPSLRRMTEDDFLQFVANNPEAQALLQKALATASALPSLTPAATGTPSACFSLSAPADGAVLAASAPAVFGWSEQPGSARYMLTLLQPGGSEITSAVTGTSFTRQMNDLPAGSYLWKVTAYDANLQPVCTAGPFTFSLPAPPTPTPRPEGATATAVATPAQPAGGVTLLSPADGAALDATGFADVTRSAWPGAYKYILNIKPPSTPVVTFLAWTPSQRRFMESLPEAGNYQWWVTVRDNTGLQMCESVKFSFTKQKTSVPVEPTGAGSGTGSGPFQDRIGPTGDLQSCQALTFAVNAANAGGGQVVLLYSAYNNLPNGDDAHLGLILVSGSSYRGTFNFPAFAGRTVYWRFALDNNGSYSLDTPSFSFTCP